MKVQRSARRDQAVHADDLEVAALDLTQLAIRRLLFQRSSGAPLRYQALPWVFRMLSGIASPRC